MRMPTAKAPAIAIAQRSVVERANSVRRTEDETGAALAMDHGGFAGRVDLVTQPAHMDIDEIGVGDKTIIPDVFEQHGACHRLPLTAHHIFEKPALPRQQLHLAAASLCRAVDQVEFERTD